LVTEEAIRGVEWTAGLDALRRRELWRVGAISAAAHLVVIAALALAPELGGRPPALPAAIPVELVAAPGGAPAAPAPPAPEPRPEAPAQKVVLPEKPADVEPEPKPAPEKAPEAPAEPEPRPERRAEPQKSLEDVMRELRAEAGEPGPAPAPERTARAEAGAATGSAAGMPGGSARGAQVSPEVAAWLRRARIHVRNRWVLAPGFRTLDLETQVRVELDAEGRIVGEPEITRPSGNPWYDESVVRALVKASPLPPPPEPGEWPFVFQPGDAL